MTNLDSPAVARYRVRLALRTARKDKQLTQGQVAQAMQWSLSKVIRIEKGEVNVSANDLRALLDHLDVTDPDEVRRLLDDAWLSRQERFKTDPVERAHMTAAMRQYFQFEANASIVRCYNDRVVPSILQTVAYTEAMFRNSPPKLPADTVAAQIAVRRRRLQRVLYRADARPFLVLLDESVLHRPLGGLRVMADQVDDLLRIVRDTPLVIRIVPFLVDDLKDTFIGPFMMYDLTGSAGGLLYRESGSKEEIVDNEPELARHRQIFDRIWSHALDAVESAAVLEASAKRYRQDAVHEAL